MPIARPAWVSVVSGLNSNASVRSCSLSLARPKSSTLTRPSGLTMTFDGLEVAVLDALGVRRGERLGERHGDLQELGERQAAGAE